MSEALRLANEEADRVEAEEGSEDAPPADDPQPVDEPVDVPKQPADEPSSNVAMEKAIAKMENENARHAKRVAEIMGADFDLVYPCTHCQDFAAGFTFTPPDSDIPMLQAEEWERCSACNGHGQKLTGALSDATPVNTCRDCNGQGFREKIQPLPTPLAPATEANPNHSLADQLRAQGYMVIEPPASYPQPAS